jgi:hypothetical protein
MSGRPIVTLSNSPSGFVRRPSAAAGTPNALESLPSSQVGGPNAPVGSPNDPVDGPNASVGIIRKTLSPREIGIKSTANLE